MTSLVLCPGCGALFPDIKGATHRYIESSPGCWAADGEVLAREYADPAVFGRVHRLTVDTCAVQQPGSHADTRSAFARALQCIGHRHGTTVKQA